MNDIEKVDQQIGLSESNYYNLARLGKNDGWRYLLSTFIILFCWLGFSVILGLALSAFILFDNNPATGFDVNSSQLVGVNPWIELAVSLVSFIPLLIGLVLVVKFIHRRPIISLITPRQHIDWKRIAIGFLSFWVLILFGCIFEAILYPGRYQFTFNANEYIKYVPLIVIFIPIQAATEELVFRGYLIQSLNLLTKRPWIPIIVSSALFMLLHFSNPEVAADLVLTFAYYLAVGIFMALISLKDNCLELAIGGHIGINMFVLLANYSDSVLPVPSVFTVNTLDPVYNLISFIVMAIIFYTGLHLTNIKKQ
jgi:membrane protease YdiL (CAAX protease family)